MKLNKLFKKIYMALATLPYMLTSVTIVNADDGYGTIKSFQQFKNMMANNDSTSAQGLKALINIGKNVGIALVVGLFIICVYSLLVQTGKLGGTSMLGPDSTPRSKQEAYEGIKHAIIGLAVVGSAAFIFNFVMSFIVG